MARQYAVITYTVKGDDLIQRHHDTYDNRHVAIREAKRLIVSMNQHWTCGRVEVEILENRTIAGVQQVKGLAFSGESAVWADRSQNLQQEDTHE